MPQQAPSRRTPRRAIPDGVWTPLATALITLVPGIVGMVAGRPALFPSLGPTALMQAHSPEHPSARLYNVVAAHLLGLGSGFLAVTLFGIARAQSVFQVGELSWARVGAAVLAVALASALELLLRASHPPAASTTLLAALGSFHPTLADTVTVVLGVLAVGAAGELLRRARLRDEERAHDIDRVRPAPGGPR